MNKTKYNMSFTAASLMKHESRVLAAAYVQTGSWDSVRELVVKENILGARTISSAKRLFRELQIRLKHLTNDALRFLSEEANDSEQSQILWFCVCQTYPFIREFAQEVLHESVMSLKCSIKTEDYDRFFNKKAQWHKEIDSLSESTEQKIRQVIFRMLKEAGFMDKEGNLYTVSSSEKIALLTKVRVRELGSLLPASIEGGVK